MILKAKEILQENNIAFTSIEPIGHHQLGRNHVYLVCNKEHKMILKIYSKTIKFQSEKKGLTLFSDMKEIPNLIASGKEKQLWLLMEALEGEGLEKLWDDIGEDNKLALLERIGELLGKIHSRQTFDYFGQWEEMDDNFVKKDYITYRKNNDINIMRKIREQHLPEEAIFEKAYDQLIGLYETLDANIKSVICHRDYSFRNMLVKKKDGRYILTGLLDFEHCQPDDGAIDFNTLYQYNMLNSKEKEEAFYKGYEKYKKRSLDFEERKKYYMINLGLHSCSWSYGIADDFYKNSVNLLKQYVK